MANKFNRSISLLLAFALLLSLLPTAAFAEETPAMALMDFIELPADETINDPTVEPTEKPEAKPTPEPSDAPAPEPTEAPVLPEIEAYIPVEADDAADFVITDGVLTAYNGTDANVVIPEGVTKIGDRVFSENTTITNVSLPSTLTHIGAEAFYRCSNLLTADLPDGLVSIGASAFSRCSSLQSVSFPASVTTVGDFAFEKCNTLTSVTYPATIINPGRGIFYYCSRLRSVTIAEGVKTVPNAIFHYCENLCSVSLPDGLETIDALAFNIDDAPMLTQLVIPASVTAIASDALNIGGPVVFYVYENSYAHTFVVEKNFNYQLIGDTPIVPPEMSDFQIDGDTLLAYYGTDENVVVPDGIKFLANGVFKSNQFLKTVTLPEGLESISKETFYNCRNLTSVSIPSTVTFISISAFGECHSLRSLSLPEGIVEIYSDTFNGCKSLTSINIPGSVERIYDRAFADCHSLTGITLPESLDRIDDEAFLNCRSLTELVIPENVDEFGDNVFKGCTNLHVYVHEGSYGHSYCEDYSEEDGFTYEVIRPVTLSRPAMGLSYVISSLNLRLTWEAVENATGYELWRSDAPNGEYTKIGETTALELTDTSCLFGRINYYKVRAYATVAGERTFSDFSVYRSCFGLATPGIRSVEKTANGVKITAATVANATGYYIYRCETATGTYTRLGSTTLANGVNSFLDTTAVTGKTYHYKARAYHVAESGVTYVGPFSAAKSIVLSDLQLARVVMGPHTVISSLDLKLTWNAVENADGYELWRSDAADGTYTKVADVTALQHIDRCIFGKINYYKVRAYANVGSGRVYGQFSVYRSSFGLATPGIQTLTSTSQGIKITHASVANATGYYISRGESPNGPFTRIGQSSVVNGVNTFVDTTAVPGKTYYYRCNVYHISYTYVSTGVTYVGPLSVAKPCTR